MTGSVDLRVLRSRFCTGSVIGMATILFSIQSIAQQYVEILREIIGIDCSILDDQQRSEERRVGKECRL